MSLRETEMKKEYLLIVFKQEKTNMSRIWTKCTFSMQKVRSLTEFLYKRGHILIEKRGQFKDISLPKETIDKMKDLKWID
jgi:predicted transcriptional regulator